MSVTAIATAVSGLATIAPKIAGWLAGDGAEKTAEEVADIAKSVTGQSDTQAAVDTIKQDPEQARLFQEAINEYELKTKKQYTERMGIVNETAQVGYKEGVYWRRAVGWAFVLCSVLVVVRVTILPVILSAMGHADVLKEAPVNLELIKWVFYCFLAVLGVSSWHEGLMGRTMSGEKEGKLERLFKSFRGKE